MHTKFWSESLKGKDHSEELDIDGSIILKWIFIKRVSKYGLGSCG
jgi:hypothetical protein